ncbi:MAG: RNA methyltransferase [bacterium]|nr:RNA methyltransferase [bacterium]
MKKITSRTNPEIKAVHALKEAKFRTEMKQFIAEGKRVCATLLHYKHNLVALYTTESQLATARSLVSENNIVLVSDHVMEKISTTTTPSELLGVFTIQKTPKIETLNSGLVLVNIADPGNMGTLIRSAAAFGAQSIIIIEGVDPWSPKVVHASAGTIGAISLFQLSWEQLLMHKKNNKLYALVVKNGKSPRNISFKNALLIVGSEAHGIPEKWIGDCDERITLPMPGKTESLNAAIAGSIVMYLAFASGEQTHF